jgi:2-hydroxychromene-2-carboxylate isomerase
MTMRGAVAAQFEGVFDRYVGEVFRNMWAEPKKMDDPDVVRAALEQSGLNAAVLLAPRRSQPSRSACSRIRKKASPAAPSVARPSSSVPRYSSARTGSATSKKS